VRIAFVGQSTFFAACALEEESERVRTTFVEYRHGADPEPMLARLLAFAPDAAVVFRPEILPPGTMDAIGAPVLGFLTEPLPRASAGADDTPAPHPNLAYNLAELAKIDPGNVDRVITFDPHGWDAAAALVPLWRAMPLPVDDRLYRAPRPSRRPPRIIFIGYSTMHREQSLVALKHEFDLPHYAHALMGDELRDVLWSADAGLNIHGEEWVRSFENRVLLHLASGALVITEVLEPLFGLEPGLDVLQVSDRHELSLRVHQLIQMPGMHDRIRIRGHHKSRQFAASKLWPRVIGDLFADLAAFGTERQTLRTPAPRRA